MVGAKSVGPGTASPYDDLHTFAQAACERCPCPENQSWLFRGQGNYNDMSGKYFRHAAATPLSAGTSSMSVIGGTYDMFWQALAPAAAFTDEDNIDGTLGSVSSADSMANGVCSYMPQAVADTHDAAWQQCADPMLLGGCTRHMECLSTEFCMDCSLCKEFETSHGDNNRAPLCGACQNIAQAANPTADASGRNQNSAKKVTATCAPKRPFLGMFATQLDAFGVTKDVTTDNVNDSLGNCILNCPKKGLDALAIYDLDTFTG